MAPRTIVCTVTNDLNFDQRMMRICTSLQAAGYDVLLTGRSRRQSAPLQERPFRQKRLFCFFEKGKLFYAEYNIRLFFFLLFCRADVFCAIDLDTILPNLYASRIRKKKRVYDAHELFCEMEEIVSRPGIYKAWKKIEAISVPHFRKGYTIGECYASEFERMYGVQYQVVRNATVLQPLQAADPGRERYILYQGAVNEGRCFETLIPAMAEVNCKLIVCGQGNFFEQALKLTQQYGLQHKIEFKGYVAPEQLREYTRNAWIGITLFSGGKSNFLSMANRFFDYMHSGVPQLAMAYPEYQRVNARFEIAALLPDTRITTIAQALNGLLADDAHHRLLHENALKAREIYCWQEEEKKLVQFYHQLFAN